MTFPWITFSRQTVADHVQSAKHTSRNNKRQANSDDASPAPKRQATINGCHERQTEASAAKDRIVVNLVETFMAANIPLEKLDNPKMREFLDTAVKGSGGVYQLQTAYVSITCQTYTASSKRISWSN